MDYVAQTFDDNFMADPRRKTLDRQHVFYQWNTGGTRTKTQPPATMQQKAIMWLPPQTSRHQSKQHQRPRGEPSSQCYVEPTQSSTTNPDTNPSKKVRIGIGSLLRRGSNPAPGPTKMLDYVS
eukprot:scaffold59246_cov62-Attheya_sp.AAC.4